MARTAKLTTKDLVLIFGVTPMTILNWRKPTEGARKKPLPCTVAGRNVEFNAIRVKAWANTNGVPMVHDPLDVAEGTHLTKAKPGPKPKANGGPRLTNGEVARIAHGAKPSRAATVRKKLASAVRSRAAAQKAKAH